MVCWRALMHKLPTMSGSECLYHEFLSLSAFIIALSFHTREISWGETQLYVPWDEQSWVYNFHFSCFESFYLVNIFLERYFCHFYLFD